MQFTRLRVLTSTFSLLNKGYKKEICEILFHYCGCSKKVFTIFSNTTQRMPIWYPKSNHFQFSLTQKYCNTSRWRWIECSSTFSNGCYLPSCGVSGMQTTMTLFAKRNVWYSIWLVDSGSMALALREQFSRALHSWATTPLVMILLCFWFWFKKINVFLCFMFYVFFW